MARKVLVRLVDDLDGSPSADVAPVTFALDGVTYQIDLNQRNASRLRDSLAAFVANARRTSGRAKRGTAIRAGSGSGANDVSAIREWAKEQGYPVSARGRIPANILDAYNSAGGAAADSAPKASRTTTRTSRAKTAAAAKSAPTATAPAKRGRPASKPAAAKAAPKTANAETAKTTKSAAAAKSSAGKASTSRATGRTTRAAAAKSANAKAGKTTRTAGAAKPSATPAPRRAVARKAKG